MHKRFCCLDLDSSRVLTTHYAQFEELYFPFSKAQSYSSTLDLDVSSFLDGVVVLPAAHVMRPLSPALGASVPRLLHILSDEVESPHSPALDPVPGPAPVVAHAPAPVLDNAPAPAPADVPLMQCLIILHHRSSMLVHPMVTRARA